MARRCCTDKVLGFNAWKFQPESQRVMWSLPTGFFLWQFYNLQLLASPFLKLAASSKVELKELCLWQTYNFFVVQGSMERKMMHNEERTYVPGCPRPVWPNKTDWDILRSSLSCTFFPAPRTRTRELPTSVLGQGQRTTVKRCQEPLCPSRKTARA